MNKNCLLLTGLCLFVTAMPLTSHAESLDDASIRGLYAEAAAAIRDADKTRHIMEDRFDKNFTLKSNMSETVGNNPPQNSTESYDKAKTIANAMKGYSEMKMETYQTNITSIQYSDDHKYALVNDTTSSTGTISVPSDEGRVLTAKYHDNESCVDKVALAGTKLMLMQSDCNDKLVVTK